MKFGYCIENFDVHLSPEKLIQTAQLLEQKDFDSLWVTDHIMQKKASRLPIYDNIAEAITTLSFLIGHTKNIKLGVSTLVLPIRNPILVAKQLATVDYLSGGRLVSSFAVGWNDEEFGIIGQNFKNRGKRMNEEISLIRQLWEGKTSFSGENYNFDNVTFEPLRKELAHQQFLIAGNSKYAIERAIKFGTGWHPAGGISGAEARKLLEPYEDKIPEDFEIWARKGIADEDIGEIIREYREHNIDGVIIDLSRTKDPEEHGKKFQELMDAVKQERAK
ncbi:MAG: LLM class flavin-dependent oxidoreductase [Candidatus Heimdallarchaeota archaeon]|nr:LLM class flavin-dependent oxidoreductase [Candidatus Heimdallarchaeota archaeon]